MQSLDPDLEEPRLANAVLSSDRPADNQEVSAAAREGELQRVEGMKIAQSAVHGIGMSTNDFRRIRTAKPNHALAVSILFTRATNQTIMPGTPPSHVLSTSLLYNSLLHDSRFMQVPIGRATPGDIVLQSGKLPDGYAGIVVDHGRVISDSSQGVRNDSSLVESERLLPTIHLFRYIGVQKYPGYTAAILANAGYNANEPRLPAGQPGGGQWTDGGGSDISEAVQEKLWTHNNPKYRAAIAAVAWAHEHDKSWLKSGKYTNKCNLAVADWIYEATGSAPSYRGRPPLAREWADPKAKIDGWSAPFPVHNAQPGDVIAQSHEGGENGHVGIMVAPGKTASANALENPAGIVTVNNWGFRPNTEANGGRPGDPMPVARRYIGY